MAWWVIESVFLRSPDKGFWACLEDIPPDGRGCNLMLKLCGILRSSAILGSDSPQSNHREDNSIWVTPFIPRERPNVKHAIAGSLWLPRPTSALALMPGAALAPLLSGGTRVHHWQSARRLWPDTRRLQLPLSGRYKTVNNKKMSLKY